MLGENCFTGSIQLLTTMKRICWDKAVLHAAYHCLPQRRGYVGTILFYMQHTIAYHKEEDMLGQSCFTCSIPLLTTMKRICCGKTVLHAAYHCLAQRRGYVGTKLFYMQHTIAYHNEEHMLGQSCFTGSIQLLTTKKRICWDKAVLHAAYHCLPQRRGYVVGKLFYMQHTIAYHKDKDMLEQSCFTGSIPLLTTTAVLRKVVVLRLYY